MGVKRRFTITMNAQRVLNSSITSAAALLRQSSPVTRIAAAGGSSTSGEWGGVYVDRHNSTNSWSAQWATSSQQQQQALGSVREMSQQELMDSYISSLRDIKHRIRRNDLLSTRHPIVNPFVGQEEETGYNEKLNTSSFACMCWCSIIEMMVIKI